jgi:pectate lyase
MRGIRLRTGAVGSEFNPNYDGPGGIYIRGNKDIILDRNSIAWTNDDAIWFWNNSTKIDGKPVPYAETQRNITLQWNIIAEGIKDDRLRYSGTGLLISGLKKNITLHHNLFANFRGRRPLIKHSVEGEVINNVNGPGSRMSLEFSTRANAPMPPGPLRLNIINNNYDNSGLIRFSSKGETPKNGNFMANKDNAVYLSGNKLFGRSVPRDQWSIVTFDENRDRVAISLSPAASSTGVTTHSADDARRHVLAQAGATKRDFVDTRIINRVETRGHGGTISPSQASSYPNIAQGTPWLDSDGGGLPESYEQANGLDPNNNSDDTSFHSSGYMHVEVWANSLIPCPPGLDCALPSGGGTR